MPHARPEQALQQQVAEYLHAVLVPPWWFSAIGHGGGGARRGAILQGMGVKRGVPDLLILGPDRFIAWIELKSTAGRLRGEQADFMRMVEGLGHRGCVCRSLDDVWRALIIWNVPTREAR